jgi:hypothetical protein
MRQLIMKAQRLYVSEAVNPLMRSASLALWLIAGLGAVFSGGAQAGDVMFQSGIGRFNVPIRSIDEIRWDTVVRQQYDFSCGSAAIATLLTHHYDLPTSEDTVFKVMFAIGDQKHIRKLGFSLLDMKRYLDKRGLRSDGFKMTAEKLVKKGMPGITLISTNGYKHFVVVKGIRNDKVLVGDPALGTRVIPLEEFKEMWTGGAVLQARERAQIAQQHFNHARDWRARPDAPVGQGVGRDSIGQFTINLPGLNEFYQ